MAEPQLEAFAGQPLDFRRQAPESVTKASRRRGNHRAGRWLGPGFPISAAGRLRAICRSARLPRFGGPTGDFARRRTNGRVGRSPRAKGGRWPARCPQRNSCITISPDSAIISSFKRGGALGRARSVFSSFAINILRNRSDHPHGTRFSAYRRGEVTATGRGRDGQRFGGCARCLACGGGVQRFEVANCDIEHRAGKGAETAQDFALPHINHAATRSA